MRLCPIAPIGVDAGRWTRRFSALVLALGAVGAWGKKALAADVEITSTTATQGYSLRNAWGDPVLMRRRFLQTLGMTVANIGGPPTDSKAPRVAFRMRLRIDADFGHNWNEYTPTGSQRTFVPGLQIAPVDLMYGYLDASNLAGGLLSFRLGRQYTMDALGWWSFDGALVRAELPVHVAIESYGGFEQRGGLPLSSPRYEREGVWRGDRDKLDANVYPEFLQAHMAPAYGAMIESWGLPVVHGRLAYRKVWNTGSVVTNSLAATPTTPPPTFGGTRVSSERVGASIDLDVQDVGLLRAGSIYDLHREVLSSLYGSVDVFASKKVTLGADVDRLVPTFDGDSIWNWFAVDPATTAIARAEWQPSKRLGLSGSGGLRWVEISTEDSGTKTWVDTLGRAAGRYRWDTGTLGTSGLVDRSDRGRRYGGDLFGEKWLEQRFLLSARVSLYDWKDQVRTDRSATSLGYVLGGGYRPGPDTTVLLEWEHDTNRLVGQRYRVMALVQGVVNR